ncbi:MAG: hypothetical protein HND51_01985 [Chloroflexi bacterium]|nr:hypothetical protein [Chloroflexota bacterium]
MLVLIEPHLLAYLESCQDEGISSTEATQKLKSALTPVISALRALTAQQRKGLAACTTTEEAQAILCAALSNSWGQGLKATTRQQYHTKIRRFLPLTEDQAPRYSGDRRPSKHASVRSGSTNNSLVNRKRYDQQTRQQENATLDEMVQGAKEHLRSSARQSRYDLYPGALWVNPTAHTPGVLNAIILAALLPYTLEWPSPRRERACVALICGLMLGWTQVLKNARLDGPTGARPEIVLNARGHLWMYPWQPEWLPAWLNDDEERRDSHFDVHHAPMSEYQLHLHPTIQHAIREAAKSGSKDLLFPGDSYREAIQDLDKVLKDMLPAAGSLTPGRLTLSFQGLANSAGYPWPERYAVFGRPARPHTMAAAYSLTPIHAVIRWHWRFVEQLLAKAQRAYQENQERFGPAPWPGAFEPNQSFPPRVQGFLGSWSMPKFKYVCQLVQHLGSQIDDGNLARCNAHNARTRLAVILGAITMGLRPGEIDGLTIPKRQPLEGDGFAQEVKRRGREVASWVERRIPRLLQPIWWHMLRAGASLRSDGQAQPMILGEDGHPQRFRLKTELASACQAAGLPASIRPHGLRHFCRTALAHFGLSDPDLALVMNHWAQGFERTSFVRLGNDLAGFDDRYNRAVGKLLKALGWEDQVWA